MTTAPEEKNLISPVTTPSSLTSTDKYLNQLSKKFPLPWYVQYKPPYAVITASILEIISHSVIRKDELKVLRFDPGKQEEAWRFFTYMLVHDSWYHLILNVVIQCLFATHLEKRQGSLRVGLLYVASGAVGALGAACVEPDLIVGASAGVYALLISYVADVVLNFQTIKYKITRCVSVALIVVSDVIYNLVHFHNKIHPSISWGAHVSGAVAGFLIGLIVYRNLDEGEKTHTKVFFVTGLLLFALMLVTLLVINLQIKNVHKKNS